MANCSCIQSCSVPVTTPTCPTPDTGCLIACSDILACADGVGPCGTTGTFDLSTLNHNTTICTTPLNLKWSLKAFDDTKLISASIDRNSGVLTWVTGSSDYAGQFANVCFSISCDPTCEDCFPLEHIATFAVGISDLCSLHDCDECETCDPCTGLCVENSSNLLSQDGANTSNITADVNV